MLNIGPAELLVIGLVLLIAVGPEQLPGVIRRVGSSVAQLRSMTDGLRTEFMAGLDEMERAADVKRWTNDDDEPGSPSPTGETTGSSEATTDPAETADGTGSPSNRRQGPALGSSGISSANGSAAADDNRPRPESSAPVDNEDDPA